MLVLVVGSYVRNENTVTDSFMLCGLAGAGRALGQGAGAAVSGSGSSSGAGEASANTVEASSEAEAEVAGHTVDRIVRPSRVN